MNVHRLPGIRICGFSGSGKTTLTERLIPILKKRGYESICQKYSGHSHSLNPQGKDTQRFADAGAKHSAIRTPEQSVIYSSPAQTLDAVFLQSGFDLLLIEGFANQHSEFPAFVVIHPEKGILENIENIIGYIGQKPLKSTAQPEPFFQADAIEQIADFLIERLTQYQLETIGLKSCVLIGGKSKRMGKEKFNLCYGNEPEYRRMFLLLKNLFPEMPVYFSGRVEQKEKLAAYQKFFIEDAYSGKGPFNGILTLLEKFPQNAFAVFGCDYPLLDEQIITDLFRLRNPLKSATVFYSPEGVFETVCGIYEPGVYPRYLADKLFRPKNFRPQVFLGSLNIKKIFPSESCLKKLKSVDTPENAEKILKSLKVVKP